MKKTVVGLLDLIHHTALALWLGGMVVLGALVAPILYRSKLLTTQDADGVYQALLNRFTPWIEICGVALIVVQFLLRRRYQKQRNLFILDGVRQLLTFGALLLAEMCFRNLLPNLNSARRLGELANIGKWEGMYTLLAVSQVGILVTVLATTIWLTLPNSLTTNRRTSPEETAPTPTRRKRRR
jgi:putative copper export protein